MFEGMNIRPKYERHQEALERVKELIKTMNELTEEEFISKYNHKPNFHKGINVLADLFMEAKFNE